MSTVSRLEALASAFPTAQKREYNRPDIVILRSIADASDEIREELKAIGEEKRYVTALRMLVKHAHTIDSLSKVLIERFERAGDDGAVFYEEPEP